MKAAVVEKPGTLTVREIEVPKPGEYGALCKLLYGATCSGTDLLLADGRFPWPVKYPTVLGHESIGRVIKVGRKVRNLEIGDLVSRVGTVPSADGKLDVHWGGFAEYGIAGDYLAMREDGLNSRIWQPYRIHRILPPEMDPAALTMVITWRETLSYITRMGIRTGAKILIIGSGGNGLALLTHAVCTGAERVVMVGNAKRRDIAVSAGAADYFDYKNSEFPSQLRSKYSGGFDFIIDAIGKADTADNVLNLLKQAGTIGLYGVDDYWNIRLNPQRARGSFTLYNDGYDEEEVHNKVVAKIRKKQLRAGLWLDLQHPFPLREINRAMEAVRERKMVKALVCLS